MRAVDDEALVQQLLHYVLARHFQLQRDHEPRSANFLHNRQASQFFKAVLEVVAGFTNVFQKVVVLDDLEVFQAGAARQRRRTVRRIGAQEWRPTLTLPAAATRRMELGMVGVDWALCSAG